MKKSKDKDKKSKVAKEAATPKAPPPKKEEEEPMASCLSAAVFRR